MTGEPFYTHHIFVCTNRRDAGNSRGCCASKGSEELLDYMKAKVKALGLPKVRVNKSGCLDRCEMGITVVDYPTGTWHTIRSKDDVDRLVGDIT